MTPSGRCRTLLHLVKDVISGNSCYCRNLIFDRFWRANGVLLGWLEGEGTAFSADRSTPRLATSPRPGRSHLGSPMPCEPPARTPRAALLAASEHAKSNTRTRAAIRPSGATAPGTHARSSPRAGTATAQGSLQTDRAVLADGDQAARPLDIVPGSPAPSSRPFPTLLVPKLSTV